MDRRKVDGLLVLTAIDRVPFVGAVSVYHCFVYLVKAFIDDFATKTHQLPTGY